MGKKSVKAKKAYLQLAAEIDRFAFKFDSGEYLVSGNDRDLVIEDIADDIADGNVGYLSEYMVDTIAQKKYSPDFKAKDLANSLNLLMQMMQYAR